MIRVLMVEDNPGDARHAREQILSGAVHAEFDIVEVSRLNEAIRELATQNFQAILLDLTLPDANGLEALALTKHAAPDIPIIVVSGLQDEARAVAALTHGAQDYLVKGNTDGASLARAILYAIERQRSDRSNYRMAHYDGLTDIPNRKLLYDRLNQALSRARRNNLSIALLFLDLDHFKEVNDSLGHLAGDKLLQLVARRLVTCTRASDTVARLGGDEFGLLLPDIVGREDAAHFAGKILHALDSVFIVENQELYVSASIGISLFPDDAVDTNGLLKTSDVAMYCAKQDGGSNYQVYSTRMSSSAPQRLGVGNSLWDALTREEFVLHFQPLVELGGGTVVGVEALLRWEHPSLGLLPPARFVPMAEHTGSIVSIGEWVLRRTCEQAREWRKAGHRSLEVAVNLSPRQLTQPGLFETVRAVMEQNEIEPGALELSLTDGAVLDDPGSADDALRCLKQLGVRIALDGFGTGPLSLSRLRQFSFDTLKIDRSFVQRAAETRTDAEIAKGIITMAHGLGIKVVAGGVETREQLAFFRKHDCDQAQGFHMGRPQLASELERNVFPALPALRQRAGGLHHPSARYRD